MKLNLGSAAYSRVLVSWIVIDRETLLMAETFKNSHTCAFSDVLVKLKFKCGICHSNIANTLQESKNAFYTLHAHRNGKKEKI